MVIAQPQAPHTQSQSLTIEWEKLPVDFILPNDPVDNMTQPALAAALTDSLNQAGLITDTAFTMTNYGVCATVNGQIVLSNDVAKIRHGSVKGWLSLIATTPTP